MEGVYCLFEDSDSFVCVSVLDYAGSAMFVMGNICFKAPEGGGALDLAGQWNTCMAGHTELQMPGNAPRQNAWLPSIYRLSMPVGQRPPSGCVGLPRDQAAGVECSDAACGCVMAGYSIELLPTRYVEEAIYFGRAAGGHRHHRNSCRTITFGDFQIQDQGPANPVRE